MVALRLRQQVAVLADQRLAVPGEIRAGLARPRRGVDIRRQAARRLAEDTARDRLLMSVTEGKCYATSEMETLLTEAGFRDFAFAVYTWDADFRARVMAGG